LSSKAKNARSGGPQKPIKSYRAANGSWYVRAFAGARNSATVAWAKCVMLGRQLVDPQLQTQIQQAVPSQYVAAAQDNNRTPPAKVYP
jgi:hypothetical protein